MRFRRPDGRSARLVLGAVDLTNTETKDPATGRPAVPQIGQPLTLGQARALAVEVERERVRGVDVIGQRKAARERLSAADAADATTFTACAREFFAEYRIKRWGTRPRRWRDDAAVLGLKYPVGADPAVVEPSVISGSLADIWRDRTVADLDGHDVHVVVREAAKYGSAGRARKLHAALSVLFGWLKRQRRVTGNPCVDVDRPSPPPSRDRVLSDAEIAAFWRGCDALVPPYGALFRLLLLSGARLREVANMKQAEIEDGVWTVPAERSKNHRPLSLPLPPLALKVLASVPVIGTKGFMFTTSGERGVTAFGQNKTALDAAMAQQTGRAVKPWVLHDLRRSTASGLQRLGVRSETIERALNHQSNVYKGVAGIYQRDPLTDEVREALERWAQHITGLVAGRAANVVAMKAKASKPGKARHA